MTITSRHMVPHPPITASRTTPIASRIHIKITPLHRRSYLRPAAPVSAPWAVSSLGSRDANEQNRPRLKQKIFLLFWGEISLRGTRITR